MEWLVLKNGWGNGWYLRMVGGPLFHGTDWTRLDQIHTLFSGMYWANYLSHEVLIASHCSGTSANAFFLTSYSDYITKTLHITHIMAKYGIHSFHCRDMGVTFN